MNLHNVEELKDPKSVLIANTCLSLLNDRNKTPVSKSEWKRISTIVAESDQLIAKLEAKYQ